MTIPWLIQNSERVDLSVCFCLIYSMRYNFHVFFLLGGGFKHVFVSVHPYLGEDFQFD